MRFLEELAARRRFGMRPGLEAIRAACAALGDPQERFPAIHVAGTNGKGAVCALLDATLRARGLRVGRYTSPHLIRLNERFFLDGAPVDDTVLERVSDRVRRTIEPSDRRTIADLTFFEALTAVAFCLYAEAKVDLAVLECGLGGRLDATNVCRPQLCVITKIGLDHCDWLGATEEAIAGEKAGIVKPGVPIVLGRNEPSVRAVVETRARTVGAPYFYAPELASEADIPDGFSLDGTFNRENAVTALAALKVLCGDEDVGAAVRQGFGQVVWPGRFQRIGDVIVDGAHNPPAARALADALQGQKVALVAGFCGDKDVDRVLSILAPHVTHGFAVRTNNPRSLAAEDMAAKMRSAGIASDACDGLSEALERARKTESTTLVCGSLFLAGEALVALEACPWPSPRFDPAELLSPKTKAQNFKTETTNDERK